MADCVIDAVGAAGGSLTREPNPEGLTRTPIRREWNPDTRLVGKILQKGME